MGTREEGETDGVGVFVHHRLHNLLGSLVKSGVDHFEAGVTKSTGNDLGPTVMTVKAWLGHYHSICARHVREA